MDTKTSKYRQILLDLDRNTCNHTGKMECGYKIRPISNQSNVQMNFQIEVAIMLISTLNLNACQKKNQTQNFVEIIKQGISILSRLNCKYVLNMVGMNVLHRMKYKNFLRKTNLKTYKYTLQITWSISRINNSKGSNEISTLTKDFISVLTQKKLSLQMYMYERLSISSLAIFFLQNLKLINFLEWKTQIGLMIHMTYFKRRSMNKLMKSN